MIFPLLMTACQPTQDQEQSAVAFSLVPSVVQMNVGDVQMLGLSTKVNGTVEWSSSDEEVAKVSKGVVSGEGVGFATITAQVGTSKAICSVYVSGTAGQTLTVNKYLLSLEKGEQEQLVAKNTYGTPVVWSSKDEKIAIVDQNGMVTAVSPGLTTVVVSSEMESKNINVAVKHHWGPYQLVWTEEFDGSELDRTTWTVEVNGNGGGNQESQYYLDRPENLRVENGNLILQLRNDGYNGKPYTSGRINSRGKKEFLYGKIEARISFPSGQGTWPAFWMLGNRGSWPLCGEIDIVEHVGSRPEFTSFAVHTQDKNGTKGTNWHAGYTAPYSMENEFHVYGIEWTQEEENGCDAIHFCVDGVEYAVVQENIAVVNQKMYWPFNEPHYIILNLAIGGTMGGRIDDAIFNQGEVLMKVDWIKVWQRDEAE